MLRKIATCLLLCFYIGSFCTVPIARSSLGIGIIAAASIGAALAASATGTYYAQTGHAPEYVTATAGAVASAADYLFQPANLAYGPIALVTAASFPAVASVYIGKPAAVGAQVGNIYQHCLDNPSAYPEMNQLLSSHSSLPTIDFEHATSGSVFTAPGGQKYKINALQYATTYLDNAAWFSQMQVLSVGPVYTWLYYQYYSVHRLYRKTNQQVGPNDYRWYNTFLAITPTNDAETLPNNPGAPIYADMKTVLQDMTADQAAEVRKAISEVPPVAQVKASDIPVAGTGQPPVAITQTDIDKAIADNKVEVAEKVKQQADERLAADPLNTTLQREADQATYELTKAQGEAAEKATEEDYAADTPSLEAREVAQIDFSPITELGNQFSTVFPFGLISSISSGFNSLASSPVTPAFTIDLGITQKQVTLASFDYLASIIRSIISFLMYAMTGFFCFKLYARA